jgi:hypothetical protein
MIGYHLSLNQEPLNYILTAFYSSNIYMNNCNPNPDIASFYSMNVTGVTPAGVQGNGGQNKTASAPSTTNSSNATANVTNQTRTIVSK